MKHTLIALFALTVSFSVSGQSVSLTEVIREIPDVRNLWWDADSNHFSFLSVEGSLGTWYSVDALNNTVVQLTESPDQLSITMQDLEVLQAQLPFEIDQHSVYEAPNDEWVAIGISSPLTATVSVESTSESAEVNLAEYPKLTLLHRPSSQMIQTPLPVLHSTGVEFFNIQWSENSKSFVVSDTPVYWTAPTIFHYVTDFDDEMSDDLTIEDISSVTTEDEAVYKTYRIYDISAGGEKMLLRGMHYDSTTQRETQRLLLWNASTRRATSLEGVDIRGLLTAAFAPASTTRIHLVIESGLIEYDTITNTTMLLREDVNSERFTSVYSQFSHDGRYLALVEQESANSWANVYLLTLP